MNIPVSCNKDCGAGCPLTARVENGRVTKISDSPEKGRWMSGCARGYSSHKIIYHPERLLNPMIKNRQTGLFREASWDEAISYSAEKLQQVREQYGCTSVLHLGGGGACRGALHHTYRLAVRFLGLYGGYTSSTDSYSSAAVSFVTPYVFGTSNAAVDAGSLMDSEFILLPGANIADLRFGCELLNRLKALRKQGVRIIVIDPRKTRTVTELDAEWIKINPGTDTAFIAAVIHDLLENGGADKAFIDKYTHGFDEFKNWLYDIPVKNAEWASSICGVSPDAIREVAGCYRRYSPAALIPGLSIQRALGGEDAARMMMVLQSVTGNVGRLGGSNGANIWGPMPNVRCGKLGMASGSAGAQTRFAPVYGWPDMILDKDLSPPLKAVYNCGGNYIVQGADTAKSVRAFEALDFSVTHDLFMTPTAKLSDVVFPVADYLERNDIVFPEGNFLLYSQMAVEPPENVKTDYEIFSLLAEKMGFGAQYTEGRNEEEWLNKFLDSSELTDIEGFKRRGIWFGADNARITLSDFVADPVNNPLMTPSGRIEISSEKFAAIGGNPFPVYVEHWSEGRFRLITPHARNRINSQFMNIQKKKCGRLQMNRGDAELLHIEDGGRVRIVSDTGSIEVEVDLSIDIISGTACLDSSYSNMLTSTLPTLPSGGARTHSTFVDIQPS